MSSICWLYVSDLDKGRLENVEIDYPFPKRQILDSSKLKEFAEDNFEFNENGRKSSERAENTVGKGEIARYEQFLLFPQCFQKTLSADTLKTGLVWERVKLGTDTTPTDDINK